MSDRTARILVTLALIPGCVGLYVAISRAWEARLLSFGLFHSSRQCGMFLAPPLLFLLIAALWRGYCVLSRWRIAFTLFAAAVLVLHAQIWRSVFEFGSDDDICVAQTMLLAGVLWVALAIVWWENSMMEYPEKRGTMTRDTVRLVSSFGLVPIFTACFILAESWCQSALVSYHNTGIYAFAFCSVVTMVGWLVIWRDRVAWSTRTVGATFALGATLLGSSVFATDSLTIWAPLRYSVPFLAVAAWFAGTAWIWRRADSGAASGVIEPDTVRCPQCGYNLKGLKAVKCPECGWESTIDELVRLTLARAEAV